MNYRYWSLAATALAIALSSPAVALDIVLTDTSSPPATAAELAAMEQAAQVLENQFDDPILVNVLIGFAQIDSRGVTFTARTTHRWTAVRAAMVTDATPGSEAAAVVQLDPLRLPVVDINGPRDALDITMTTANAKALGLGTGLDPSYSNPPIGIDAEIIIDSDTRSSYDLDPSDGIGASQVDFVGLLVHELGHALGFTSQTEVQEGNPGFAIGPAVSDVWRWPDNGIAHVLSFGSRLFDIGPAEWYDSVLNNVAMSHGVNSLDIECDALQRRCQSSHWSDEFDYTMNPTLGTDELLVLFEQDKHALDYIGYDRSGYVRGTLDDIDDGVVGWFDLNTAVPMMGGFPVAPWPPATTPPWANLAWVMFSDMGDLGKRALAGPAEFVPGGQVSGEVLASPPVQPGHFDLYPIGEPVTQRPPALHRMTLTSDNSAGVTFRFRATCAQSGCQYDPALGAFGGYRVPGQLDGSADNVADIDGRVTLTLLADQALVPDPAARNVFILDTNTTEPRVQIFDRQAFGLSPLPDQDDDGVADAFDNCSAIANPSQRDSDRDHIGNACDGDIAVPNDCFVNFSDVLVFREVLFTIFGAPQYNPDADLNDDKVVNFSDLMLMRDLLFGSPGPSGIANDCD